MNDSGSHPSVSTTTNRANSERPRRSSRFAWWLAGLTLGLVVIVEMPNELLSWRYAAALEARDAGKKEEANKVLAELLQKRPDDPRFLAAQYTWNKEDGKYETALSYVQKLITAESEGTEFFAGLLHERSQLYLHLQRYPEAIADCLELARFHKTTGRPSREEVLNSLAYSRALAGTDLDAALIDIDAAIAISRANFRDAEQILQRAVAAKKGAFAANEFLNMQRRSLLGCVDTRGLVRFKQADYAAAQTDFDEAVESMRLVREYYRLHDDALSARERSYRDFAAKRRLLDHNDAVIYYHRSLNLRKLGRDDEAQRDWDKARELIGKEPDESLF
jgi:tetratricopeptide (TPR) repeat protein